MFNQGQRAAENKESAKMSTAVTSGLCVAVDTWLRTTTHHPKNPEYRLLPVILYTVYCVYTVLFPQYNTHHVVCNMIPLTLHSKDHVWRSQKIRGGIQILFPKGFSLCKCSSFNILPSPHCHLPSSPTNLFQNPPKHWTHSPLHCCHGGHLNIKFPSS